MITYWSSNAQRNFYKVIDYLIENWTFQEVENFQNRISKLIRNIQENPNFCPQSKFLNIHKCLVDKQNSLIYLLENQTLFIVDIIDNRSNHSY